MSKGFLERPAAPSPPGDPFLPMRLDFVWTMPEGLDGNRHLRPMIESEAKRCPGLSVRFFTAPDYLDRLRRGEYGNTGGARPDGVVLFGSILTVECDLYQLVRQIRQELGCRIAAWTPDDPYEFDFNLRLAEMVDWLFTNDRNTALYYGADNVTALPLAAAEATHVLPQPDYLPGDDAEWDFCFCGAAFANRKETIAGLYPVLRRYRTVIVGNLTGELKWPAQELPGLSFQEALSYEEVLALYRRSRVVLNLSRYHDLCNDLFHILPSTPAPRTYEVAAMGIPQFVFLDRVEIFEDYAGDEMAAFASLSEFESLSERYLGSHALRHALGRKARARTQAQHLYRHRLGALAATLFAGVPAAPDTRTAERRGLPMSEVTR